MTNLLIVDKTIPSLNTFLYSINDNTKTITYSLSDTFDSLKEKINNLQINSFDNIGFVFVDEFTPLKMFVSYNTFMSYNNNVIIENNTTNFIKELVSTYSVKKLDFLACNLLSYPEWKNYFEYLMKENEGLIVRASNNTTGNLTSGGDWILESTNEDISNLYFSNIIDNWFGLLDITDHFAIIKSDGTLWTCGDNSFGQKGIGNTNNTLTTNYIFSQAIQSDNSVLNNVVMVVTGNMQTVALKSDGTVWFCGWDNNMFGLVSGGVTYTKFTQCTDLTNIVMIACSSRHTVAISKDKNIFVCGDNTSGNLGISGIEYTNTFIQVPDINDAIGVACDDGHTIIIRENGTVWGCGNTVYGQLGINVSGAYVPDRYQFTQCYSNIFNTTTNSYEYITGATSVACGRYYTAIVKSDGTIWTTGYNNFGQLGLGNTTDVNKFTLVSGINNAIAVACGYYHTLIIRSDKSVWSTGNNLYSQLGTTQTNHSSSFIQASQYITSISFFSNALSVICPGLSSCIIKSDNTVWVCGRNNNRQLGLNQVTNQVLFKNNNFTSAKYTKIPKKNINNSGFSTNNLTNINTNDSWAFLPNMYDSQITAINNFNEPTSYFINFSDKLKVVKLEPSNTIFTEYISFDISNINTNGLIVYCKSDNDSTHIRLYNYPNNSYGAYYTIPDGTSNTVRIFTKHFSEIGIGTGNFCLLKGTKVLTPDGYKLIETLKYNDIIITDDNREVPIKMIYKTIINPNEKPHFIPYKIEKNSIAENYPLEDTYMSGYHMIKYGNNWIEPIQSSKFRKDLSIKEIVYYHIQLENYETDNLVVNGGLVVESLGNGSSYDGNIWCNRSKNSIIIE